MKDFQVRYEVLVDVEVRIVVNTGSFLHENTILHEKANLYFYGRIHTEEKGFTGADVWIGSLAAFQKTGRFLSLAH